MKLNTKVVCAIFISVIISGVAIAELVGGGRTYQNTLPDGTLVSSLEPLGIYNITNLLASVPIGQENNLYYKVIVPNDNDNQWNLSLEFAESKPFVIIQPYPDDDPKNITINLDTRWTYTWVCCNVTKGDRLYTADATSNSSLRGTLTNMYDLNYKTRLFNYTDMSWENRNIGASTNPKVYNRRAALHQDGTQIAYAMETKNVSVVGVPELMKVFLI